METRGYDYSHESTVSDALREALRDLMIVEEIKVLSGAKKPVVQFGGRLIGDTETAFDEIIRRFEALGYTPLLSADGEEQRVQAVPVVVEAKTGKPRVNLVLFLLTVLSTLYIGALWDGIAIKAPLDILGGWRFSLALLAILTAHELSHYFVGRHYGSPTSLPYFIPLPLQGSLGTLGAVIIQRGPVRSRKALFDIGIAGPLGGLLVAIPLLFLGLTYSDVVKPERLDLPRNSEGNVYLMQEGNSILYLTAKYIVHGRILPDKSTGEDVWLGPPSTGGSVTFAAWAGLLVTMFNLFPVGQLDGGHVAYAMWGRKAWQIARYTLFAIVGWGLLLMVMQNPGGMSWLVAGGLGASVGPQHPPPLNDMTPLDPRRRALGWVLVGVFLLILIPIPWTISAL